MRAIETLMAEGHMNRKKDKLRAICQRVKDGERLVAEDAVTLLIARERGDFGGVARELPTNAVIAACLPAA